ncbi:LOW QUALITY PROTEIN: hypothetical protein CFOL_v3_12751 [Cephalotus follicularis]|uniref:Uncharacterized protein n=1 Tax=Cephalotus follicularis TaxID=3775 RepID=A0A1Q3BMK3_CEPFO|nr:LOW QUALITY PROTEIN: hypothetical protein CFOL_v3_12751 [Cephalotus follicularis]
MEKEKFPIQWPASLRSPTHKRDSSKYCQYHRDHGHDMEDYWHLKNQIKDLICKGHLRNYVNRDASQERRECREEAPQQADEQQPKGRKMLKIGGEEEVIAFSKSDLEGVHLPHDDPVMITLLMELFTMKRVLVDSASLADILHKLTFDQLRIIEDQLKPVKTSLIGFSGEIVHPLGSIDLFVIAGFSPATQAQMTFLVVDTPSPYNAKIGHP